MGSDDEVIGSVDVTDANGSPGGKTVTIDVPSTANADNYGGGYYYWFCEVGVTCKGDDTQDEDSALTIYRTGSRSIETASITNTAVGNVVYFSRADIEPRTVTAVETVTRDAVTYSEIHLDESIAALPIPGTDTLSSVQMLGVDLYSLSLYELLVTDFGAKAGYV
jgi:hypothetical protein